VTFVEFGGLGLVTMPGRVMSPRPASVALVERALEHIGGAPSVVVDVGTGSGAIAIAIARGAPQAVVWATDVSREAADLAAANAARCGVADRVRVRRGDLLEPVPGRIDVIVANLPYLPWHERTLHPDLAFEPAHAVFGAGDGLDPYRRLVSVAGSRLAETGILIVQLRAQVIEGRPEEVGRLAGDLVGRAA
jgi:release factor glutamine methyltransferase